MPPAVGRSSPGHGYESEVDYRCRLGVDLERNSQLIEQRRGYCPRAIVWPYGRHNATATSVAMELGMPLASLRRVQMTAYMGGAQRLERELAVRRQDTGDTARAVKAMHVDLDNFDAPNPEQIDGVRTALGSAGASCSGRRNRRASGVLAA
ncbi:polysaccharide deacetylase family protein [Cyanobium sp. ATX 6F1]|uniref:polysaccharide deacetylase family protein n=1 Tax=unclassified Cyanobium TaxID=2627006 RepID=UPI0020CC7BCC|nr:polysaccharide deacetylase family protein [Cyanobium sp. ATX 6F1]MCP9915657.1 hypothetical protein [Cyanobium sp. ATX 6F1]